MAPAALAESGQSPQVIVSATTFLRDPVIAVDQRGLVTIAWQRTLTAEQRSQIVMVSEPNWQPQIISQAKAPSPDAPALQELTAYSDPGPRLAWQQREQESWYLCSYDVSSGQRLTRSVETELPWTAVLDEADRDYYAATSPQGLIVWSQEASPTLVSLSPSWELDDLALAVSDAGQASLAWSGKPQDSISTSIGYAVITDTPQAELLAEGADPQLAIEGANVAHLAWREASGIEYANSEKWSERAHPLVKGDPLSYQMVVDDDEVAHVAWIGDGAVWYASAVDWDQPPQRLDVPGEARQAALTIDARGHPHVACTSLQNDGVYNLSYIDPDPAPPQIAISFPQQGDLVDGTRPASVTCNQWPKEILRVAFYLQPEEQCAGDHGPWQQIGLDRDGSDGWTIDLPFEQMDTRQRYRLMAIATRVDGQTPRTIGDWFRIQPQDAPWVWLYPSPVEEIRGEGIIRALVGGSIEQDLDLYLTPTATNDPFKTQGKALLQDSRYLGHFQLSPPSGGQLAHWETLPFDSRQVPDGRYLAQGITDDALTPDALYSEPSNALQINNSMPPDIARVNVSQPENVASRLTVSAVVSDPDGDVAQVDFFLQRNHSGLGDAAIGENDLFWLGSDDEGLDGWRLTVPVASAWRGDAWQVWAVAKDNQGLTSRKCTASAFAITGPNPAPLQIINPQAGSQIQGTATVTVKVDDDQASLQKVRIVSSDSTGTLHQLAEVSAPSQIVTATWDTLQVPEGQYELLAIGEGAEGNQSMTRVANLSVRHTTPPWRFVTPKPGAEVGGTIRIVAESTDDAYRPVAASFYVGDRDGRLYPLAEDTTPADGLSTLWRSTDFVDGSYELVAALTDEQGQTFEISQSVRVRNSTPTIRLDQATQKTYSESQRLTWMAKHPLGEAISVTISYSPDNGQHWIPLASDLAGQESFMWDTTTCPDSDEGRLRLLVTDGTRYARAESVLFSLNNTNDRPHVSFVSPRPNSRLGARETLLWQAWDSDGDEILVDLYYREGDGAWQAIALGLENSGQYTWEPPVARSDETYALRIEARDGHDAQSMDQVTDLTLSGNGAPSIRLVWPHSDVKLSQEAVILWNASDPDDDPLAIDLYYSDNAGSAWYPLAEGLANTGYYRWQLSFLPGSTEYRMRVVARDGEATVWDESEGVFQIDSTEGHRITFLDPQSNDVLTGLVNVHWSAADCDGDPLTLQLSGRRPGGAWRPIAEGLTNTGWYVWDTTDWQDGAIELALRCSDGENVTTSLRGPYRVLNEKNLAPQVSLKAPQGGEIWQGTQIVRWAAHDPDSDVLTATIQLLEPKTEQWHDLASVPARQGRMLWDTEEASSGPRHRIRVVVSDGMKEASDASPGTFTIANRLVYPPSLCWSPPNDQEDLASRGNVEWIVEDADGESTQIALSLSRNGGLYWEPVDTGLPGIGQFDCSEVLESGESYWLRLSAQDATYLSFKEMGPLTCPRSKASPPSLDILLPRAGDSLEGSVPIAWQAGPLGRRELVVDIDYSADGGLTWQSLAQSIQDTDQYEWDTTSVANGTYRLRLTADSGQAQAIATRSSIIIENKGGNRPVLSLLSPKPGDTWLGARDIQWQAYDPDQDRLGIGLYYRIGRHGSWQQLAHNVPNVGHHAWNTINIMNNDDVWVRASVTDGSFSTQATLPGPIEVCNPWESSISFSANSHSLNSDDGIILNWSSSQKTTSSPRVRLEYWDEGLQTWQEIESELPADGQLCWNALPTLPGSPTTIRAVAEEHMKTYLDEIVVCSPCTTQEPSDPINLLLP